MITFKSTEDLARIPPEDPAYPTVKELVDRYRKPSSATMDRN